MRLHSTKASFLNREITALAIAESLVATGITVGLAWHGRWVYLACAALVTPLLMLRTPESTERGVRWFNGGIEWLFDKVLGCFQKFTFPYHAEIVFEAVLGVASLLPLMVLYSLAVKLVSTLTSLLVRPLSCLLAIPRNWFAQTFCIDSFHPPELVPGFDSAPDTGLNSVFRFSGFIWSLKLMVADDPRVAVLPSWVPKPLARFSVIYAVIFAFLLVMPAYLLAVIYRLSLKGTAIVWLPLLWIVPKLAPKESVMTRLRLLNQSSWGRLTAFLSVLTVVAFIAKIAIYQGKVMLSKVAFDGNLGRLLQDYVAPTILPPWQVASVINAVVAIALFLWGGNKIIRLQDPAYADRQTSGDWILRSTSVIRAALSLYTSSCLVYLAVVRAQVFSLPTLGSRLFPWMH